jgi:hypothetical protein
LIGAEAEALVHNGIEHLPFATEIGLSDERIGDSRETRALARTRGVHLVRPGFLGQHVEVTGGDILLFERVCFACREGETGWRNQVPGTMNAVTIPKGKRRTPPHNERQHFPMVFVGRPDAQQRGCCLAGVFTDGDQDAKSSVHYSRRVGDCRVGGANGDSIRASHAHWSRPSPLGSSL